MAVTKLWKVSVRLGQVLDYTTNPEKTANPEYSAEDYQALKDVLAYAKDEEKTEHEFFCDGINCNVAMARDQFITVKEQFGKTDGIQAYHGYLSFKENEVTPEQAQQIGMQTELQGAKGHLKNMGLLFMGKAAKEAEHSKSDKGVLSRLSRLFEKAQKGFASLEQKAMDTADKLRVSRVKSSVKENLSRYRAAAKAEKGTERSEPAASKEENRTVQALGQISVPHQQKSNLSKER